MSAQELNIFTVRPDGTPLWLPAVMCKSMGIRKGDHLTRAQYEGGLIQGLISRRLQEEAPRRKTALSPHTL